MRIYEFIDLLENKGSKKLTKLYHYAEEKYDQLKTKEAQKQTNEDRRDDPDYDKHLSFFFEPVPLDIIGDIFKGTTNDFWINGNKIWQYEISIDRLPEFRYEIVESPLHTYLFYDEKYLDMPEKEWDKMHDEKRKAAGEFGNNKDELVKAASPMIGVSRELYKKMPSRDNWDEIQDLYAATVPHVMLYPKGGIVNYDNVKQVVIGKKDTI